ncbi:response regulator transcription factor [Roseibaca sp. Y0-43]|uniref:response regulator transcription factor n=1 Tax=Roseibaca sp. Y0-43 TaxID=2816854 RepID=UPI001D0C650B|nr:response regulator transcription factor [Roseibaca sp. Y0-43]MCC1480250.1 response regulator transcription factor [Roseibaca sp. Y0-43]
MRLLIADDHELLRDTLGSFLQQQDGIDICTVGDLNAAIALLDKGEAFDLILLDYTMPGVNGLDGLKRLLERPGTPPAALISGNADMGVALQAMRLGAQGFLQKSIPARSLLNAIRFMVAGERFLPVDDVLSYLSGQGATVGLPTEASALSLTPRETQVLAALCDGQTNKEIARSLNLSEPTIKLHVKTLYRRLGATNRTQAAMIARNLGLN